MWHVSKSSKLVTPRFYHQSQQQSAVVVQEHRKSCGGLQNCARETPIFWKSTSHCSDMYLTSIGGKMDIK